MELTFTHWFLPTPLPIALADSVGTANQLKSHFAFILHSAIKSGATINQGEGPIGKGLWNAAINHCSKEVYTIIQICGNIGGNTAHIGKIPQTTE